MVQSEIVKAKALSSPVRVKILKLVKQRPHTLTEVSNALGISKTNAKTHLKKLVAAGLIEEKPRSKWKYYSLKPEYASAGFVHVLVPLCSLILAIVSLQQALTNTLPVISPDHEYSSLSFTPLGWFYLFSSIILGIVFIASLFWFAFLRTKTKR